MKQHDQRMWEILEDNPSVAIAWYLMSAYTYYHLDDTIITDGAFDKLAKWILEKWDDIDHPHKHFITQDDLRSGTLLIDYTTLPTITKDAAQRLLTER